MVSLVSKYVARLNRIPGSVSLGVLEKIEFLSKCLLLSRPGNLIINCFRLCACSFDACVAKKVPAMTVYTSHVLSNASKLEVIVTAIGSSSRYRASRYRHRPQNNIEGLRARRNDGRSRSSHGAPSEALYFLSNIAEINLSWAPRQVYDGAPIKLQQRGKIVHEFCICESSLLQQSIVG